jgi:prevent-host-death family protein
MGLTVGIRELKQNPSAVLAAVKAGEDVIITERGKPIARIVEIMQSPLEEMIASGEVTLPEGDFREVLKSTNPVRPPEGTPSTAQRLAWSRGYDDED